MKYTYLIVLKDGQRQGLLQQYASEDEAWNACKEDAQGKEVHLLCVMGQEDIRVFDPPTPPVIQIPFKVAYISKTGRSYA